MAKLIDQNAAELASTLVALAGPVKSFVEDAEFIRTLEQTAKKQSNGKIQSALIFYSDLTPLLLGERHLKDTITILAAIEGEDPKTMLRKNGAEVLADALRAWDEQLKDFFLRLNATA